MGFDAATVRDIVRETKLASGTFYNYFSSKEEVFAALLDDLALRVRPRIQAARSQATSLEEFVRGSIVAFYQWLRDDREGFELLRRNAGVLRGRMSTREIVAGFGELHDDISQGIAMKVLPRVDAEYLTAAMIGVVFEVGDRMLRREFPDPEAAADFAAALIVGGISALPRLPMDDSDTGGR